MGLRWFDDGGGLLARHCVAISLIGLDQPAEAATRLERLALDSPPTDQENRVVFLTQAAHAWSLGGQPRRADTLLSDLLTAAPHDLSLRLDRAAVRLELEENWKAIDDLDAVLESEPDNIEALLYRASAYRYVDALDLARTDVDRVLAQAPDIPEAWLELGILLQFEGNFEGTRRAWAEALRLAPSGPVANAVRARLEEMDVIR